MSTPLNTLSAGLIAVGLAVGGFFIGRGFVDAKALERSVVVKGLAEREVPADTAIWPLAFRVAGDDLTQLLATVESQSKQVQSFLAGQGFPSAEITVLAPVVTDRQAQNYTDPNLRFRYLAEQVITVYTSNVQGVTVASKALLEVAKKGIVFSSNRHEHPTHFLFNGLSALKPEMVEEATRNARTVAEKFAADSKSRLGGIKTASQGQFSVTDRDANTPHIKRVRVVSTLRYTLVD